MINIKKILSKFWREIAIVVLLIGLMISVRSCKVNNDHAFVSSTKYDSAYNVAHYYKNKKDELVAQVSTHELTIKNLKEYGEQLDFDNATLKQQVGSLKNLTAFWKGKAGMRDTVTVVLHDTTFVDKNGNTVAANDFKWNNKFLYLNGLISNHEITIGYDYNVDFSITAYRKSKKGFWKPPGQLVTDIIFSDPNFRITEFKGFVVKEEPKKWFQTTGAKIGFGVLVGGYAVYKIAR